MLEKDKHYDLVILPLSTLGLFAISVCAFSRNSRKAIHKRDKEKSALSGEEGKLVCGHIDHDKNNPHYNNPNNGRLLTIREHYLDHYNRHGKNGLSKDDNRDTAKGLWFMLPKSKRLGLPSWEDLI